LVVDFSRAVFILEVGECEFVVSLSGHLQLSFNVVEGGLLERGVEMLGGLQAGGRLTDIIEIHQ
jgi:hypothetical protein